MNVATQISLQALMSCLNLPPWLAIALHRSQAACRPRPRWAARIRQNVRPIEPARPRLPRRSA